MEHAHRRGLLVELEDGVELRVHGLPVARVGRSDSVRHRVGDRAGDRPVDVARNVVELVDPLVGGGERARREQRREVRACGHRDGADSLGVEAALRRLGADHPDGTLSVLPCALVDRQPLRTRRAVHEVDALEADGGELLRPHLDPVEVWRRVLLLLVGHHRDLLVLRVWHPALRPDANPLGERRPRKADGAQHRKHRARSAPRTDKHRTVHIYVSFLVI